MYTLTPLVIAGGILLATVTGGIRHWGDRQKFDDVVNRGSTAFLVFTYVIFSAVSTKIFQTFSVRRAAKGCIQ